MAPGKIRFICNQCLILNSRKAPSIDNNAVLTQFYHMENNYKYKEITEKIIKAAYTIHNELGYGFLEKVYKNALVLEIRSAGLIAVSERPIEIFYRNQIIGEYFADIIVENKIIVEVKAFKEIIPVHEVQLLNYLKATGLEIGLLLNFGYSAEVRRKILENPVNLRSSVS